MCLVWRHIGRQLQQKQVLQPVLNLSVAVWPHRTLVPGDGGSMFLQTAVPQLSYMHLFPEGACRARPGRAVAGAGTLA